MIEFAALDNKNGAPFLYLCPSSTILHSGSLLLTNTLIQNQRRTPPQHQPPIILSDHGNRRPQNPDPRLGDRHCARGCNRACEECARRVRVVLLRAASTSSKSGRGG